MSNDQNIRELARELELAKAQVEKQNQQIALLSVDKKEFLDNMSRELRTPLNSMIILAKLLSDNAEGNLTPKQIGFSTAIHDASSDLLQLVNQILDIASNPAQ